MIEYNYLDLLKERQLNWIPIHFSKTKIADSELWNKEKLLSWVRSKLKGRFSLIKSPMISKNDKLQSELVIAFEDQKELTYFLLACPYIRRT
jgi:hypothetical protein